MPDEKFTLKIYYRLKSADLDKWLEDTIATGELSKEQIASLQMYVLQEKRGINALINEVRKGTKTLAELPDYVEIEKQYLGSAALRRTYGRVSEGRLVAGGKMLEYEGEYYESNAPYIKIASGEARKILREYEKAPEWEQATREARAVQEALKNRWLMGHEWREKREQFTRAFETQKQQEQMQIEPGLLGLMQTAQAEGAPTQDIEAALRQTYPNLPDQGELASTLTYRIGQKRTEQTQREALMFRQQYPRWYEKFQGWYGKSIEKLPTEATPVRPLDWFPSWLRKQEGFEEGKPLLPEATGGTKTYPWITAEPFIAAAQEQKRAGYMPPQRAPQWTPARQ